VVHVFITGSTSTAGLEISVLDPKPLSDLQLTNSNCVSLVTLNKCVTMWA